MLNYSSFKRIYYTSDTNLFRGGIPSFQMKVRAFFKEEDIEGTLFVFFNKTTKQVKLYYETSKGCWITTYKLRVGKFAVPSIEGDTTKISIDELRWIIDGFRLSKSEKWSFSY